MNQKKPESIQLIEGLHSTPARRYLSTKPIPDEIIWNLLDAAIRGPSGGNNQKWGWIVIRDKSTKEQISEWYRNEWNRSYGIRRKAIMQGTDQSDSLGARNYLSAEHLSNHIQEAPVWIIAILRDMVLSNNPRSGSSIYGAVQNLILAARAYGIGATLTTLYSSHEDRVKELLNIPDDAMTMALIPLGYPNRGKWSQPRRQPVENVTYWESWDVQKVSRSY